MFFKTLQARVFIFVLFFLIPFFSISGDLSMDVKVVNNFLLDGFNVVETKQATMDGEEVLITRYEKKPNVNLFGEHISFVTKKQGRLVGMTRMVKDFETRGLELPNQHKAKDIAMKFLDDFAPDLLTNINVQWIKQHDEVVRVDGKQHVISGMKVKCRDSKTGMYFWVIVGRNNQVIVFERDIIWNFMQGGRQTEKWLHDEWLEKNKS